MSSSEVFEDHWSECPTRTDEEKCSCNDSCPRCGQWFKNGTTEETEEGVCPDCWDDILDRD